MGCSLLLGRRVLQFGDRRSRGGCVVKQVGYCGWQQCGTYGEKDRQANNQQRRAYKYTFEERMAIPV